MIFAAGLGTRLRPLTDNMPKALVPVAGKTMLERVILKLKDASFHDITINIHHFGSQIIDFLRANQNFGVDIHISDERGELLDTGGGIKKARPLLESNEPFLIHNADILTDLDLNAFYHHHLESDADATLLTNHRKTSRYLLMNQDNRLCGWTNLSTGEVLPQRTQLSQRSLSVAGLWLHPCSFSLYFPLYGRRTLDRKIFHYSILCGYLPESMHSGISYRQRKLV